MTFIYTGVGSRRTPPDVLRFMEKFAKYCASNGAKLRSGAAEGADEAFERGAIAGTNLRSFVNTEIYIPWRRFNNSTSHRFPPNNEAEMIAASLHPAWDVLPHTVRMLHARNVHQVMGPDLKTPSAFVVCWTPDGAQMPHECSKETGGTAMAIKVASKFGVQVFNLKRRMMAHAVLARIKELGATKDF